MNKTFVMIHFSKYISLKVIFLNVIKIHMKLNKHKIHYSRGGGGHIAN